jgi:preprotein translocase subunit SecD
MTTVVNTARLLCAIALLIGAPASMQAAAIDCIPASIEIVIEVPPEIPVDASGSLFDLITQTIAWRLDHLGVNDAEVSRIGIRQIVVRASAFGDPEALIGATRPPDSLEIIDPQGEFLPEGTLVTTTLGGPESVPNLSATPASATPGPIYTTIISGSDFADVFPTYSQLGEVIFGFRLKSDAADTFFAFTSDNIGRPMSVVLDKRVIMTAVINAAISSEGLIDGLTEVEAMDLVLQFSASALGVPLQVVHSREIPGSCSEADAISGS